MGVRGLKEHEEVARGSEAALPQGLVISPVFNPGPSCVCAECIFCPTSTRSDTKSSVLRDGAEPTPPQQGSHAARPDGVFC